MTITSATTRRFVASATEGKTADLAEMGAGRDDLTHAIGHGFDPAFSA